MPLWKQRLLARLQSPEPGAAGGGTVPPPSAPPEIPENLQPVVQSMIDTAVSTQVGGLKSKNSELIATQKTLKDELKKFEGIDPEAVRNILKKFGDEEEAALIAKGEIDKVLNNRTERMAKDWEKKVNIEKERADKLEAKNAKLAQRATAEAVLKAANKTGALPEATEDIVLRAQGAGWTINEDGEVVAMKDGEVVLGKDGKTPCAKPPLTCGRGLRVQVQQAPW